MAVTDDAFELVRDLNRLKQIALDSGNTELQALAVNISNRVSRLSQSLTDLLRERDEIKDVIDPNKTYSANKLSRQARSNPNNPNSVGVIGSLRPKGLNGPAVP